MAHHPHHSCFSRHQSCTFLNTAGIQSSPYTVTCSNPVCKLTPICEKKILRDYLPNKGSLVYTRLPTADNFLSASRNQVLAKFPRAKSRICLTTHEIPIEEINNTDFHALTKPLWKNSVKNTPDFNILILTICNLFTIYSLIIKSFRGEGKRRKRWRS